MGMMVSVFKFVKMAMVLRPWQSNAKELANGRNSAVNAGAVNIQVRDKSQAVQTGHVNAFTFQMRLQGRTAGFGCTHQINKQNVGLRCFKLQAGNACQALRQMRHELVVIGQACDVMV
jgi:hypothetical protein